MELIIMTQTRKLFAILFFTIIASLIAGCGGGTPKEVVKEAFEKHDIKKLEEYYKKADEKQKAEYHLLYSEYLLRDYKAAIKEDVDSKYTNSYTKWEELNKMAQFAINGTDERFLKVKQLGKDIAKNYSLRKQYDTDCTTLEKYGIKEKDRIKLITRYVLNEIKNAKGKFFACGYTQILGQFIPEDERDACVLDFNKVVYEDKLRQGVNEVWVVYKGKMKLESVTGFIQNVDEYMVVSEEGKELKYKVDAELDRIKSVINDSAITRAEKMYAASGNLTEDKQVSKDPALEDMYFAAKDDDYEYYIDPKEMIRCPPHSFVDVKRVLNGKIVDTVVFDFQQDEGMQFYTSKTMGSGKVTDNSVVKEIYEQVLRNKEAWKRAKTFRNDKLKASTPNKGIITGTEVRIRSGAGTESEILGYFNKGETVDILDTASGWIKVKRSNGTVGWVSSQFCSIK